MSYKEEYQRWLDSPALSTAEWEELKAIENNDKEIESRFFAPLEFGTAGLRGEMAVGLRRMNVHVIRTGIKAGTIWERLRRGWSIEQALSKL